MQGSSVNLDAQLRLQLGRRSRGGCCSHFGEGPLHRHGDVSFGAGTVMFILPAWLSHASTGWVRRRNRGIEAVVLERRFTVDTDKRHRGTGQEVVLERYRTDNVLTPLEAQRDRASQVVHGEVQCPFENTRRSPRTITTSPTITIINREAHASLRSTLGWCHSAGCRTRSRFCNRARRWFESQHCQ